MNPIPTIPCTALAGSERALDLALVVVRAGARDGLDWWEDEALTAEGAVVLGRIFPRAARRLGRRLAVLAAQERQAGLLAALRPDVTTLLDVPAELLETREPPAEPITTEAGLRVCLLRYFPEGTAVPTLPAPSGALLDLTPLLELSGVTAEALASLLASGYLLGGRGRPVVPYVRLKPAEVA